CSSDLEHLTAVQQRHFRRELVHRGTLENRFSHGPRRVRTEHYDVLPADRIRALEDFGGSGSDRPGQDGQTNTQHNPSQHPILPRNEELVIPHCCQEPPRGPLTLDVCAE
ncbi:hypothetical protein RZS08_33325, partial [Arthrospira platensis SPKY1]|nr:hypothetical protein [Arthrospira platensis SPKY1]